MKKLFDIFSFCNPVTFSRGFRLGAELSAIIRKREGRAPTQAEYRAIADEVDRRLAMKSLATPVVGRR
jgi:hypothetical protein